MVDFEPPSGWNLPPGCFESDPRAPWKAALWARDWIVEHYKDEQEDVCDRWDG